MKPTINILFLTHYFPPEVNAPAIRTFEHAKTWIQKGAAVTVMTNTPNHPRGKVFDGYKNQNVSEMNQGIRVLRLKTYLTPNSGFSRRIINYVIFALRAIWQARKIKQVDVVIATSPQFFCGIAGAVISKIKRKPFILEIRDIWPESIISVGLLKNRAIIQILEQMEKWMVLSADLAISVTRGIQQHLQHLGQKKVLFIPNGVLTSNFSVSADAEKKVGIVIAYSGTIGLAHNVENLVLAARYFADNTGIKFMIIGDGSEREKIEKLCQGMNNLKLYPLLPRADLFVLLETIDIGIVSLINQRLFEGALPSKMFEYLAMGKPVILSLPEGEATQLVRDHDCGLTVLPEDTSDLIRAIECYVNDPGLLKIHGQNGRKMIKNKFDRNLLALDMLDAIVAEID